MKKLIAALCLLSTPALAAEQGGLDCNLDIGGKQTQVNFSVDFAQGLYTMYLGDTPFRQKQQFTVERLYGGSLEPKADGLKFVVNLSPMEVFIYHKFSDNTAYALPMSGSNPRRMGRCSGGKFRGL